MGDTASPRCGECGSTDLYWSLTLVNTSNIPDGKLYMRNIAARAILGCESCSDTVASCDAELIFEKYVSTIAALRVEVERLTDLYEAAWRECYRHRWPEEEQAASNKRFTPEQQAAMDAHDAARAKLSPPPVST